MNKEKGKRKKEEGRKEEGRREKGGIYENKLLPGLFVIIPNTFDGNQITCFCVCLMD
ncbi:MAG: hypothetical protein IMY74_00605 [Bacteroidetes bacterium]|nr:hypothetical protein [Bacteroidota bacterium]MCK5764994.1 hypothetical protein [Bacteroidales bacterium]